MNITVIQHEAFETDGTISDWAALRGHQVNHVHLWRNDPLPCVNGLDFLVLMGGSMSVNDEEKHPWLVAEKALVRDCATWRIPVLGICLGAQMIASALGARVYPGPGREIGWFEVRPAPGDSLGLGGPRMMFHWHGETFDLPPGASHAASSAAFGNQAFCTRNAVALQFHPEVTLPIAQALVKECADELDGSTWVQTPQAIIGGFTAHEAAAREYLFALLDRMARYGGRPLDKRSEFCCSAE